MGQAFLYLHLTDEETQFREGHHFPKVPQLVEVEKGLMVRFI